MAKKQKKTKSSRRKPKTYSAPQSAQSELHQYRMEKIDHYVKEPTSRKLQNERKIQVAEAGNVSVASVKAMYLKGQGKVSNWDQVMEKVTGCPQSMIISVYENYPLIAEKIDSLPPIKKRLMKNIALLTEEELELVNGLIEMALRSNKVGKKT